MTRRIDWWHAMGCLLMALSAGIVVALAWGTIVFVGTWQVGR